MFEIDTHFIIIATLILAIVTVLISFILILIRTSAEDDVLFIRSRYICVIRKKKLNLFTFLRLSLLRDRLTIFLIAFVALCFVLALYDTKSVRMATETLAYVYPMIAFCALRYYNNSLDYRIMNTLYRITPMKELLCTLGISLFIHCPLIIITLVDFSFFPLLTFSMIFFQIVLIIGILFPQIKSSINEFVATILSVIACALAILVFENAYLFVPAMILAVFIEYYLLKKGGFSLGAIR